MDKRIEKELIVEEYLKGEVSLRELGRRYGVNHLKIHRWVKEHRSERFRADAGYTKEEAGEIKRLRRELEDARLTNELLTAMIDIAEEQMGIDIRKKRGARR